jgi:uncharacterized protein YndB with AHSA1/START domain
MPAGAPVRRCPRAGSGVVRGPVAVALERNELGVVDEPVDHGNRGHVVPVYREIVPDEKLVFAWGATDGWPKLDPDRLHDSPQVTVTLRAYIGRSVDRTATALSK